MMKHILTLCLTVVLTIGVVIGVYAGDEGPEETVKLPEAMQLMAAQKVDKVMTNQDALLKMVEKSPREFTRLRNDLIRVVSFFHQRKIDGAIVEFNRGYLFNSRIANATSQRIAFKEIELKELLYR